jgi:hypothetical protein
MVLHVDSATPPGTLPLPENLKAHVYFPPNLLNEFQDSHEPIARIVQSFIENIGVPTVKRWRRAVTALGWKLKDQCKSTCTRTPLHLPLIPDSTSPGSAHYVFSGRPYGSFEIATSNPSRLFSSSSEQVEPSLLDHVAWAVEVDSLHHDLQVFQSWVIELEAIVIELRRQVNRISPLQGRQTDDIAAVTTRNRFPHPQLYMAQSMLPANVDSSSHAKVCPSPRELSGRVFLADGQLPNPSIVIYKARSTPTVNEGPHKGISATKPSLHVYVAEPSSPKPDVDGGVRPFGEFCCTFLLTHRMDQMFHEHICTLYESLPHEKWQEKIMEWFSDKEDEDTACLLAGWLYIDICADVRTLEQLVSFLQYLTPKKLNHSK